MDIFEGKICSFYKSVLGDSKTGKLPQAGVNRPILDILTKEGYTNTTLLNKLRTSGYNSDYYKLNKKYLSGATISTVQDDLTVTRSDENTLFHTGFIAFDIDVKDNPILLHGGFDEMKDFIIDNIPYVAYLGRSVSQLGLWGLLPIAYKDEHDAHYRAMQSYFLERKIIIDHTSDISRIRFIAYDPDAHIELNPQVFDLTQEEPEIQDINEICRPRPNDEFFIAACRWIEVKNNLKFKTGMIHNYLLRLYSTLRYARVSRTDALNWIYNNLIDQDKVTTNCLDEITIKKLQK